MGSIPGDDGDEASGRSILRSAEAPYNQTIGGRRSMRVKWYFTHWRLVSLNFLLKSPLLAVGTRDESQERVACLDR